MLDQQKILSTVPPNHPIHQEGMTQKMLELSREAAQSAYAPYSNFHVGAALLTKDAQTYQGANVETWNCTWHTCAEKNAIGQMVTDGVVVQQKHVLDIVSVSCIDAPEKSPIGDGTPCGGCRHSINEFADENTIIIVDDKKQGVLFRHCDLFPDSFSLGSWPQGQGHAIDVSCAQLEQATAQDDNIDSLCKVARQISAHSYAPVTGHKSGAVVRTLDGKAYLGARVENSCMDITLHADYVACKKAVFKEKAQGQFIQQIALYHDDDIKLAEDQLDRLISLDLLYEFATADCQIAICYGDVQIIRALHS